MHSNFINIYYFIDKFDEKHIKSLPKNIALIYRNYEKKISIELIKDIRDYCKISGRKFYLAGNLRLAINLNLDGAYIPAFNHSLKIKYYQIKKNFLLLGSAHNIKEINIKSLQKIDVLFISPLFNSNKKTGINILKFRKLAGYCNCKVVALGGINNKNYKKLRLLNIDGFAGITLFNAKKNGP